VRDPRPRRYHHTHAQIAKASGNIR
jgi:hypothetical protein